MTRYTLHVPLYLNDGRPVGDDYLAGLEESIIRRAGGFTRTEAIGAYRGDDGTVYREPVALLHIDSDDLDLGRELHYLAGILAVGLNQVAVYVTQHPVSVSLVTQEGVL